jgi:hypothetical protein
VRCRVWRAGIILLFTFAAAVLAGRRLKAAFPACAALMLIVEGLALGSFLPGRERIGDGGLRFVEWDPPWSAVVETTDTGIWVLLIVGLRRRETRLIAWTAVVAWVVPAAGNVFAPYELRYHQPMAGIALAAAVIIACDRWGSVFRGSSSRADRAPVSAPA